MLNKKWIGRAGLIVLVLGLFGAYHWFGIRDFLSLEFLKSKQMEFHDYYINNTLLMAVIYSGIYILTTAASLPGATILTLAGGTVFGFTKGLALVSFSSTCGATLAFLVSRFLLRDFVQSKFHEKIEKINHGLDKDGAFYLFSLRLIPLFPFFLINLVMGLTRIRVLTFFIVSWLGMIPGTIVYVNAGTQLAKIESTREILSFELLCSFAMVGLLPLLLKFLVGFYKSRKFLRRFKKPSYFDYNMVVIGAGSGGLVSAYIASALKAKVALIEKHKMGGDCLNTGCVPSKALIRSAKIFNFFKRAEDFGFDALPAKVNFAKIMERVQRVVRDIEPHDSVARYTELGVDCLQGEAFIRSPYEVEINGQRLTTKNIVIATGASPLVPPLPGLKDVAYLTSDTVWNLREFPQRLVILGGGPIGCELAQSFARLGSKVTLVEMSSRIMGREDEDVSAFVADRFHKEGISVLTSHKALRVSASEKILVCDHSGVEVEIPFDELLVALGRKANVKGFGLEALDIEIGKNGTIVADEYMRTTNYPNIFVCGDVTGPFQFTHTASYQAWFTAVNSLFSPFKKFKVDYRVIPWCTFTDPEVARVGLSEAEANEQKRPFEVTRYGIEDLDRAITESEAHGFVKVLTKPGSDFILGVTIVGDHAGDMITEYVTAMKFGIGLNKILSTIHIYPTFSEANKYAAGVWKKNNAPQKVLEFLRRFHAWRRE